MRKPQTIIAELQRRIQDLERALADTHASGSRLLARATKAETEVTEWKTRFDALLARTPNNA